MKRFALYLGLATALMASCSIKEEDVKTPPQDDVFFYASFEQPVEEGTRVYANEDLLLRWTADDRVSIFNRLTYNQEYRFTGQTGANAGGFKKVDNDEFVTGNTISHVVSIYPYQESTAISESEETSLMLPAEQHYAENTFGLGVNTMVSVTSDNVLQYKNVGGYLRLSLYGEGVSVSSITLKGNNGEKLAGKATVTMPLDGVPSVKMAEDATNQITLVCDTPINLGATAEESTQFWFVVPPVTFSKGFTITVEDSTGGTFEKSTDKAIAIERNNLSKMSPVEVAPVYVFEAIDLGLPSGLKWASWNLGASKPEEYGEYFAWGETEPKSYYFDATYKWAIIDKVVTLTKYCNKDNKSVLDLEDDAARVNWGGSWRMPTDDEWEELMNNCTWTWTTQNGVNGYRVTSNKAGFTDKSIFIPAAGDRYDNLYHVGSSGSYWSSSLYTDYPSIAGQLYFNSHRISINNSHRFYGFSVRPVYGDFIFVESISLNESSLSIDEGGTAYLTATVRPSTATAKTVTWSSSNTSVATVDSNGKVAAVSAGTATITAWSSDGQKSATCTVTVAPLHDAVDLGLSVKWAPWNLGASKPEEYGEYFAWGETEPKRNYSWSTYEWCNGYYDRLTKYCNESSLGYNGFTDNKTVLDPEDDAAYVIWGGSWRMPTDDEWEELMNNCTWTWTTQNGVNGYRVTSNKAGFTDKSIFIPAAGDRYEANLYHVGSSGS